MSKENKDPFGEQSDHTLSVVTEDHDDEGFIFDASLPQEDLMTA